MILSEILKEYYHLKYLVEHNSYYKSMLDYEHAILTASQDCTTLSVSDRGITKSLFESLRSSHRQVESHILHLLDVYRSKILELSTHYNDLSQEIYQQYLRLKLPDATQVLSYKLNLTEEDHVVFTSRLKSFTDWRYPGALFRPGNENLVEQLVDLDPLYLFDHNNDLMQPTRLKFNPNYQRRLRYYDVKDDDIDMFSALPRRCFALAVFYYFFNFKPREVIVQYLKQILPTMKPGGIVAFTINDCDYQHNAALTEKMYTCYTPGSVLLEDLYRLGYQPHFEYHGTSEFHWYELKVPGEITSYRGGQCIAKIVQKN